ncbi:MAG: hypothetical protein ACM3NO_06175 [Deltaproteobacteria bacterium]
MRSRTLFSFCGLALLMWGCPKRQTAPRLVYVPAPPPAAEKTSAPAPATGTLVIQEPVPEEPPPPVVIEEEVPQEAKPAARKRRPATASNSDSETQGDVAPQPAPEVPALEPRESAAQQNAQRQQIIGTLAGIRGRIAQLKRGNLGELERKTLEDAQMFVEQSQRALDSNDLVRALNLARKASLLVNAMQ